MTSLAIATPMYGGICSLYYTTSLVKLSNELNKLGWGHSLHFMGNESLITRARNSLVSEFLKTDGTHLLFIDADQSFRAEDIFKMVEANVDIISAVVPKKNINWQSVRWAVENQIEDIENYTGDFVINPLPGTDMTQPIDVTKPLEVESVGTGMMLIKREVFEKLNTVVPSYISDGYEDRGEEIKEYFATSIDPETRRLLSEDYHFCHLWRQQGGKVWAAPWAQVNHYGNYLFQGKAY
jgi:hypothetical protein